MKGPRLPDNEDERLKTLHDLRILDTTAEERFDRYTRIASRLFDVPIALISLVDEHRQWFKSKVGLDASETPRSVSFCGHAILDSDLFIIEDASADLRFADNPLVTGAPHVRFYAGAPLELDTGLRLGTLCIIDHQPRSLSKEDQQSLRDLASCVVDELRIFIDELTSLANVRGFRALAQNSFRLCKRHDWPAALLVIDLDDFKNINDRFGHTEGDHALAAFGALLIESFRESDVIGRLGGDEFAVFLPQTSADDAEDCVTRFKRRVAEYNARPNMPYELHFSCGLHVVDPKQRDSLEELLRKADQRMYQVKRAHGES